MRTHSELSVVPSEGAVVRVTTPEDADVIQAHIERNLKFWGIEEAFRIGRLPSNSQIDAVLAYAAKRCIPPRRTSTSTSTVYPTLALTPHQRLSADALNTITAARRLLQTVRGVVRDKNADEIVQDTLWLAHLESTGRAAEANDLALAEAHAIDRDLDVQVAGAARDYGTRKGELTQAAGHLKTLGMMFATTPELRGAISDLVKVAHEMITGEKEGEGEDEEEDEDEDEEEDEDTVEDALGVVPESSTVAETSAAAEPVGEVAAKEGAVDTTHGCGHDAASDHHMPGSFGDPSHMPSFDWFSDLDDSDDSDDSDSDDDLWLDAQSNPDTTRAKLYKLVATAVTSLQNKDGYVESMTWLLDLFESYETEMLARKHGQTTPATNMAPASRRIISNIVTIVERFARNRSVEPVQQSILTVYTDILSSPALLRLWDEVDAFIRRILIEPGYILSIDCTAMGNDLETRGRTMLHDELYNAHWTTLVNGVTGWIGWSTPPAIETAQPPRVRSPFVADPLTRRLGREWDKLIRALFLDTRRRLTFKRDLWTDLASLIVPELGKWGYIPLPRVELSNDLFDVVLENVSLSIDNLVPSLVTFEQHDLYRWSPFREAGLDARTVGMKVVVEQIQVDIKEAPFELHWKKVIKIVDRGLVDIAIARRGLTIAVDIDIDTSDHSEHILTARKIDVTIDQFKWNFHHTHRDWFYDLVFSTAGVPWLKKWVASKLETNLQEKMAELDVHLVDIRRRAAAVTKASRKETGGERGGTSALLKIVGDKINEVREAKKKRMGALAGPEGARKAVEAADGEKAEQPHHQQPRPEPTPDSDAEDPGAAPHRKKFKISARLQDTLMPTVTPNSDISWVYRRWRVEEAARRSARASTEVESGTHVLAATATGLRGGRPWRSPVFSI